MASAYEVLFDAIGVSELLKLLREELAAGWEYVGARASALDPHGS